MKQIPDFEHYLITRNGVIINSITNKELKPIVEKKGYLHVNLYKNGIRKSIKVHRLVAIAYIDNSNSYPQVNHINGIKDDNRVENLEWCNNSQNQIHAYNNGLNYISEISKSKISKANSKIVLDTENGIFYDSMKLAAKVKGISIYTLSDYLRGKTKNKTSLVYA